MSNFVRSKSKNKEKVKSHKNEIPKLKDLENQLVLRMPEPYSSRLREALSVGSLKDRLQIDVEEDLRHATVKFDGVVFAAKLVDLPCVVELWKTFDKKSLWKTGDLCQMLICRDPEGPDSSSDDEEVNSYDYLKKQLHEAKKYQYPHGLTPCLKNVRKRRFRKTAKQKYVDAPEIEKEVKRLLRADISAVNVKFEIINDELDKQKPDEQEDEADGPSHHQHHPAMTTFDENSNMSSVLGSDNDAGQPEEILPDISSSDDDNDSIIVKLEEDNKDNVIKHTQNKTKSLHGEYEKRLLIIKDKKLEQELRVHNAANPFLKQRFQGVLDNLNKEEQEINAKLNELNIKSEM